ncbi:MAG: riboflavin synthase subunit alpha [Betaproteobacteria bacterium]|jgi:riboflavin synthase|nr:riboflavin synthase subunit alpha [Betaproteobacteria bacterium]MCC6247409.1 riboflavin synthase subunit alpha [Rubrivivax sp.]
MFTGIVAGIARVERIVDKPGLRTFTLRFPDATFGRGLETGASVAVDGVCLTVTALHGEPSAPAAPDAPILAADFDVMQQSLALTTLGALAQGSGVNVERAAKDGAEIGGHPLSGHVDGLGTIVEIRRPENNHVLRIALPPALRRYVFAKGYIGVNGCSLTAAEVDRAAGWFEVWLIPETLRLTTFGAKREGDAVHIEIDRQTQVFVDTVREAIDERLGPLVPALEQLLRERGAGTLEDLARPAALPR